MLGTAASSYTRHPVHYHEDGNFILLIRSRAFCVYKGVLARRSQIFRDLFQIPQPEESTVSEGEHPLSFDGIPAAILDDDDETFAILLDLILPSGLDIALNYTVERTVSLLLLCDKYEIDDIRQRTLEWFRDVLPHTAEDIRKVRKVYAERSTALAVIQSSSVIAMHRYLPLAWYTLASKRWIDWGAMQSGRTQTLTMETQYVRFHSNISSSERLKMDVARDFCDAAGIKVLHDLSAAPAKSPRCGSIACRSEGIASQLRILISLDVGRSPLEALDRVIRTADGSLLCSSCLLEWRGSWIETRDAILGFIKVNFQNTRGTGQEEPDEVLDD